MQFIHYLSPTECGSVHDKTIAEEYPIHLPKGSTLKQDLGFVKHQPEGINIEMPYKKPKNQELTFSQKIFNKIFSGTRIVIEHANSGIKRLRIIKDIIRIHDAEFRDLVLVVACGLHNFRLLSQHPKRKYKQSRA
jgi:hypothetical protein